MIIAWLISAGVPAKLARPVLYGLIAALLVLALLTLFMCTRPDNTALVEQTKTGNASAAAITEAATGAVETIEQRNDFDNDLDAATALAQKDIGNAANVDDVRSAVAAALCLQDGHRTDAACRVH